MVGLILPCWNRWNVQQRLVGAVTVALVFVLPAGPVFAQVPSDVSSAVQQINAALSRNAPDEAAKLLDAAAERFPSNIAIDQLRLRLYSAYLTSDKPVQAAEQLAAYAKSRVRHGRLSSQDTISLASIVDRMVMTYLQAQAADTAAKVLDELTEAARQSQADPSAFVSGKAILLLETGKPDEAQTFVAQFVQEQTPRDEPSNRDAATWLRWLEALRLQRGVLERIGSSKATEAAREFSEALQQLAKVPTAPPEALNYYVNQELSEIRRLMSANAEQAAERLKSLSNWVENLGNDRLGETTRSLWTRMITDYQSVLARELRVQKLVGSSALPLGPATWLNGEPLTDDDLKGNVVLLDFWAVWCGPCIATFPHLREWHEKYHDRGLIIIGATRRYQYGWDDQAKRPRREQNRSPQDEDKATQQFLSHHQLKHRIAVLDDTSKLFEEYGINAIPTAILIDKTGKIRMVRVGSGEQNARDLEKAIEQLLAE